jgi:hypothetical protein
MYCIYRPLVLTGFIINSLVEIERLPNSTGTEKVLFSPIDSRYGIVIVVHLERLFAVVSGKRVHL